MRKSSSAVLGIIDFNPKECKIGQSIIDQLPLRPASRRNSANTLRPPSHQRSQEIEQLRAMNTQLRKQNDQLRRELEGYRKQTVTNRADCRTEIRNIIRSKMSRVKTSRATDCEEGLTSTKEMSMEPSSFTISDWYQHYKSEKRLPTLAELQDCADHFFRDYCENYAKLKSLFQCLQSGKGEKGYSKLKELIELYRVPLLYQQSPQVLLKELSRSKDKGMGVCEKGRPPNAEKGRMRTMQKQKLCWQVLSPSETITQLQGLLSKVCRSAQMLKSARGSDQVVRFILKMQERRD